MKLDAEDCSTGWATKGVFILMLRVYWPKESLLDGTWQPPSVQGQSDRKRGDRAVEEPISHGSGQIPGKIDGIFRPGGPRLDLSDQKG
jgi:hypothetical protein